MAAARWLVDKKIKMLAVDTPTPEISIDKRPPEFDWPVHHTLLRDGVLISEQIANARSLAGCRAEFLFLPLNIIGGDAHPRAYSAAASATEPHGEPAASPVFQSIGYFCLEELPSYLVRVVRYGLRFSFVTNTGPVWTSEGATRPPESLDRKSWSAAAKPCW